MKSDQRKARVTDETLEEARKLKAIWDEKRPMSQAAFGDAYKIGNQSAVGQFLRGDAPLSLKAARGFADGLDCQISDFSQRLQSELDVLAGRSSASHAVTIPMADPRHGRAKTASACRPVRPGHPSCDHL